MRLLLTNDDGIFSKGIETLFHALSLEHDVRVVAPETEQSAIGHAITMLEPLRVNVVNRNGRFFGHALKGTPADCVKIAVSELMDTAPEMVVSGINIGANVGVDVIYSGTVSAATEAAVLGIPSIAVSIDSFAPDNLGVAAEFIPKLVALAAKEGLPPGVCLNVNVPDLPAEKIRGVRITRQGAQRYVEKYDRRIDPRNHVYYWLTNECVFRDKDPDSDSCALASGFISVTPIHHDLTSHPALERLKGWGL
ncbi:MAG: 5'/3'-nucleotidase SurE [Syntrophobacteraceae bacterium]|nr:5'/3'-nucleotidase SurE [Syntrophobacteraceae bacterium]